MTRRAAFDVVRIGREPKSPWKTLHASTLVSNHGACNFTAHVSPKFRPAHETCTRRCSEIRQVSADRTELHPQLSLRGENLIITRRMLIVWSNRNWNNLEITREIQFAGAVAAFGWSRRCGSDFPDGELFPCTRVRVIMQMKEYIGEGMSESRLTPTNSAKHLWRSLLDVEKFAWRNLLAGFCAIDFDPIGSCANFIPARLGGTFL